MVHTVYLVLDTLRGTLTLMRTLDRHRLIRVLNSTADGTLPSIEGRVFRAFKPNEYNESNKTQINGSLYASAYA
jgi:hypothetical protein